MPRRIVLRVFAYVVAALALHVAASWAYWTQVAQHHKALRSDAVIAAAPHDVVVWVTGDSHPRTAIEPRLLGTRAVNGAIGGQNLLKSYYRTRTLVEDLDKDVDTLLVPLDAVTFGSWNTDQLAPEVVWGRYVDFFEVGRVRGERIRYLGYWIEANLAPYVGELRSLNQVRARRFGFGEALPNGNFGAQSLRRKIRSARQTAASHLVGEAVDPLQLWALRSLVEWAEGEGIRVVFVRYPVTRAYAWFVADARAEVDARVFGAIVDPERHLVLDHERLFFGRDHLFSDAHHLNARGRLRYTRYLARELRRHGVY